MRLDSSVVGERVMIGDDIAVLMGDFAAEAVEGEDFTAAVVEGEDFTAAVVEGEDIIIAVGEEDSIGVVVKDTSRPGMSSSWLSSLPAMSVRWASLSCILAPATQWVSRIW